MWVPKTILAKSLIGLSLWAVPVWGADTGNPLDPPPAPVRAPAPFAGTFKDAKLTLVLEADPAGGGVYRGTVTTGGADAFPVTAQGSDGKISGQFKVGEKAFAFTGTLENAVMTFTTGTTTYKLTAQNATTAVVPAPGVAPVPADPAPKRPAQGTGVFGLGPVAPGSVGMAIKTNDDNQIKVVALKPSGPAEKAGLAEGDTLVAVDGKDVRGMKEPASLIVGPAGEVVTLTVERGGKKMDVRIMREAIPAPAGGAVAEDRKAGVGININVTDRGAFITGVHPGGPAEAAGIRAGDQIIGIDGQPLRSVEQLSAGLPGAVGSPIKLTMRRGEQIGNFDLKRAITNAEGAGGAAPAAAGARNAGVGINLNVTDRGVMIQSTVADGPAARAGVQAGDQLVAIDGKPLRNVDDLSAGLPGAAGSAIRLTVLRAGKTMDLDMKREVTNK